MSTLEQETDLVTHWDREGKPISLGDWSRLWNDPDYRIVAKTPHLDAVVQTQWEGINDGVQVATMYHTGIGWAGTWTTVWEGYYPCTEADAKKAHRQIVKLLREMCPKPPAGAEYARHARAIQRNIDQLLSEAEEDDGQPTPES
ncbi:hypothetical protein [Streptomyces sp. NBC_01451]|uniref:hypothetical protein n=1 Tax=Streptomyces sp. NBC_01451 TaxID=2903872 RepID=UPI002E35BAAD|nr:hypothetical protein [Streptomyces sp. NBC_01451]